MIQGEKIGLGIATVGRKDNFKKLIESLDSSVGIIDYLHVSEDTLVDRNLNFGKQENTHTTETLSKCKHNWFCHPSMVNIGVARTKNKSLQYLLDQGCDHIFLIEDDIYIKDPQVFEKYIEASKVSGIQHFNYSQHGLMNKTFDGNSTPNPRTIIDYGSVKVPLYPHCVGAFSYYSRKCLETVGLMDENYFNACEHVDHTLEIIKAGMHPPFWHFADIENSWEYLGDEEWSLKQSTISSKNDHKEVVQKADRVFLAKHECYPAQIPLTYEDGVIESIKSIKKNYALS